jgi:hypothetical protein
MPCWDDSPGFRVFWYGYQDSWVACKKFWCSLTYSSAAKSDLILGLNRPDGPRPIASIPGVHWQNPFSVDGTIKNNPINLPTKKRWNNEHQHIKFLWFPNWKLNIQPSGIGKRVKAYITMFRELEVLYLILSNAKQNKIFTQNGSNVFGWVKFSKPELKIL